MEVLQVEFLIPLGSLITSPSRAKDSLEIFVTPHDIGSFQLHVEQGLLSDGGCLVMDGECLVMVSKGDP